MPKTIVARWGGAMHVEADAGLGGHITMDGDEGRAGSRPTELLLAALAGCAAMDVVSILAKKRQELTAYEVRVLGLQQAPHPQVFTEIDVEHVFEGEELEVSALRRAIELSATRYCPVNAHLAAGGLVIHHRLRLVRAGRDDRVDEVVSTGPFAAWPDQAGVGTPGSDRSASPM